LDVPNEINDDSFWSEFREAVKAANPEAYLVGEIWTPDRRWVGEKTFDGLLNYPFRDDLIRFIHSGTLSAVEFAEKIESLAQFYPAENALAMYNLLGSHDTERVLTKLDDDIGKTKLAFFCQFSFPGVPGIYYGDEIGLSGGKDPDCRRAFPWDEGQWEHSLRDWVKQLISIRQQRGALRRGILKRVMVDQLNSVYTFLRGEGDESVLVVINASSERQSVLIPRDQLPWMIGQMVQNLFDSQVSMIDEAGVLVEIEARSGIWMARA
jgi:cyclomaltodextrinase